MLTGSKPSPSNSNKLADSKSQPPVFNTLVPSTSLNYAKRTSISNNKLPMLLRFPMALDYFFLPSMYLSSVFLPSTVDLPLGLVRSKDSGVLVFLSVSPPLIWSNCYNSLYMRSRIDSERSWKYLMTLNECQKY